MKSDHIGLRALEAAQLPIAIGDVAMGCTMKSVAPDLMAPVQLIRDRIKVGMLRQRLVKRGVEDSDLGQSCPEDVSRGADAFDISRIVQRRKIDAAFNAAHDFVVDQHRVRKLLATMHHSMTDRVNISHAADSFDAGFFAADPMHNQIDGRARIAERGGRLLRRTFARSQRYQGFAADAFDFTPRQATISLLFDLLQIRFDQLELDGRAAAIEYQYVHDDSLKVVAASG